MTYCYCPSHPHKEDDIGLNEIVAVPVISTHIPTRRMTLCWLAKYHTRNISTHILTRRMTLREVREVWQLLFQLTSSQGGWQNRIATSCSWLVFQLTSSQGGWRGKLLYQVYYNLIFQLTSSQGGWRGNFSFGSDQLKLFQLTSSRGGWRLIGLDERQIVDISTHILTRRMTLEIESGIFLILTFQLTSSRGGWHAAVLEEMTDLIISTHILTRRMTFAYMKVIFSHLFQLTSSRGGWLFSDTYPDNWQIFQLTSSRGGWRSTSLIFSLSIFISTHILTRRMTSSCIGILYFSIFQLTSSRGGWRIRMTL